MHAVVVIAGGRAAEGGAVEDTAVDGGVEMNIKLGPARAAGDVAIASSYFGKEKR